MSAAGARDSRQVGRWSLSSEMPKCFKCEKASTHYAWWHGMTDSVPACDDHGAQFVKLSEAFEDTEQGRAMAETLSEHIRHAVPWMP